MRRNEISRRYPAERRRPARRALAAWLLALALALVCAASALAVPADGFYTYVLDGAGVLTEEEADDLEETAAAIADSYGFAPYVVTVDGLSGLSADDAALSYYDEYDMGAGDSGAGAILLVDASDGSHSFLVMNSEDVDAGTEASMENAFLAEFEESWYAGFSRYMTNFWSYFNNTVSGGAADSRMPEDDLGGMDGYFIIDYADILTDEEEQALEDRAWDIARTYGFAPCVIVEDSLEGWDVEDRAVSYYTEYEMGIGPKNNGSLLYMSMEDRDFWYLVEDHANKVFDEYRYDSVQQAFLAKFKKDDWYGGFMEYLNATEHYLSGKADAVDRENGEDWNYYGDYVPSYAGSSGRGFIGNLMVYGIPVLLALIISLVMLSKMQTVAHAAYAGSYLVGGLHMGVKEDVYTHTTESRVLVESDSDKGGGGSHGGGGGGSFGGGGKF